MRKAVILRILCIIFASFTVINNVSLACDAMILPVDLPLPSVSAQSAILVEASGGKILYEKNARVRLPMASTTKIMTAIVALENASPDMMVEVSAAAVGIEGSSVYLYAGERLTLEALLYALLLESANDAAVAIAIAVAGDTESFVERMNQKASELMLYDTHFTNPHGLDHPDHYTTAQDLSKIAAYCMHNEIFREIVSTQRMTIPLHDQEQARLLLNHNRLLRSYKGAIGLKTGFTKRSGRCLVSAARRDGIELIAVTLNAPDDWNDHRNMLDYGFSGNTSILLQTAGGYQRTLPVIGKKNGTITVTNINEIKVFLPKSHGPITVVCELPRWVAGEIKQGQPFGRLIWYCDGEVLAVEALVAQNSYSPSQDMSFLKQLFSWLFSH